MTRKRKKGKGSSICVSHICTLAFSTFLTKQCIPTFCLIMCIYFGSVLFTFLKVNKIMRWKSNFKKQNEMWAPKSFIFVQNCPKLHHLLCKIVFTQLPVVFIHGHHNLFSGPKYWHNQISYKRSSARSEQWTEWMNETPTYLYLILNNMIIFGWILVCICSTEMIQSIANIGNMLHSDLLAYLLLLLWHYWRLTLCY